MNGFFKLSNGLWVSEIDRTGPYTFDGSGFIICGTQGAPIPGSLNAFFKQDSGFWTRASDGSGPYVHVSPGQFALQSTGADGGRGGGTWGSITGALVSQTDLNTALNAKATVGKVSRAADVTATRAIAASDFGAGIMPINAAGVVALTLPTVASMDLTGSGNVLPIQVMGTGIPTFAGATASTTINGVAGMTTVLPGSVDGVGGAAPIKYQIYVFTQVGSTDNWTF